MKEKVKNALDFQIKSHTSFDQIPLIMKSNNSLDIIAVGFQTGEIRTYWLKSDLKFETAAVFDSHHTPIRNMIFLENKGLLVSVDNDKSLNINDL